MLHDTNRACEKGFSHELVEGFSHEFEGYPHEFDEVERGSDRAG